MIEKGRVHRFADLIIASEGKRNIRNAAGDHRAREILFDPAGGIDEVESVVIMLLNAGGHRQNVRIENDVILIESDLVDENPVGPLADADLLLVGGSLSFFVEGHHHHRRAVTHDVAGLSFEVFLTLFERNRVHDSLSLEVFQTFLEDFPLRGIHHDRHFRDVRFTLEKLKIAAHHRLAVDESVIEADIDDIRAVSHLLAGNFDGGLQITGTDQLGKLR